MAVSCRIRVSRLAPPVALLAVVLGSDVAVAQTHFTNAGSVVDDLRFRVALTIIHQDQRRLTMARGHLAFEVPQGTTKTYEIRLNGAMEPKLNQPLRGMLISEKRDGPSLRSAPRSGERSYTVTIMGRRLSPPPLVIEIKPVAPVIRQDRELPMALKDSLN